MKQSTKITYQTKKEIIAIIRDTKALLWKLIEFDIRTFKFTRMEYKFSLSNYRQEIYRNCNIEILIEVLEILKDLSKSRSKYIDEEDIEEFKRDLLWLEIYINECRYSSIIRWLSNIESTLNDLFHNFFENLRSNN